MEAIWDCTSQLWVPGRSRVHGRPYLTFAPQLCNTSVPGPDEYADGCLLKEGADWCPFCLGGGTGRGVWGVAGPSGVSTPKSKCVVPKKLKKQPAPLQEFISCLLYIPYHVFPPYHHIGGILYIPYHIFPASCIHHTYMVLANPREDTFERQGRSVPLIGAHGTQVQPNQASVVQRTIHLQSSITGKKCDRK